MAFKFCPSCGGSMWEGARACPDCGQFMGDGEPEDGGTPPFRSSPEEAVTDTEPKPAASPPPRWLAWRLLPHLHNPWSQRAVEIGFFLGTGMTFFGGLAAFLSGLAGWFGDENASVAGGLVFMLGSPLIGLFAGLALGAAADSLQQTWHTLVSPPAEIPTHRLLKRTSKPTFTDIDAPRTEIVARNAQVTDPEEVGADAGSALLEPAGEDAEDVPAPDEPEIALPPDARERRIVLRTFALSVVGCIGLEWLLDDTRLTATLIRGSGLGLTAGFLLSALAVRGHRRREREARHSRR